MIRSILITGLGGSGGSYFANHVLENYPKVELSGFVRWHTASSSRNLDGIRDKVKVLDVDLSDFSSVYSALRHIRPECVVHFAAHANVKSSFNNPISVLSNNVISTANLLEAVRLVSIDTKVLLVSTSEVYGVVDPKNIPITEDCPLNPASPYAVSKVAQDLLGQVYFMAYKLPVIRSRMFTYINPRRSDLFATSFALQVARIEAGKQKALLHGNLESIRTLIDVRDAMSAYWAALNRGVPGDVYNIGGTSTITVGGFLKELIGRSTEHYIDIKVDPNLLRPSDVTLQVPDTSKFFATTGWSPKHSFEESIVFLLDECRKQVEKE
jgi:GDPmannose 4,6-dehydratase/GDP-4-dehydro-6-deoxy-D-mannose reductase